MSCPGRAKRLNAMFGYEMCLKLGLRRIVDLF